ncbi:MAG: PTS sugar transporter subunit IIA [Phycisphaeraceae bacterium]|nr:MAG: PTS sugar transporter subunit IIA [Phycisphaeraceae bacterium]
MVKLTEIIAGPAVVAPMSAGDRDAAITELLDRLVAAGGAPAASRDEMLARVLEREKKGTTGFGRGVAVPHLKHKSITRIAAAVGLSPRGIDFRALDSQPVYTVILLASPEDRPEDHLQAMEAIFTCLSKDAFRRALRQAATPAEARAVLEEFDAQPMG